MTEAKIAESLRALAVPIDGLTLLPGNPRRGDVEAVARSLVAFGQRKPVVVRRDGVVIAGNHTTMAARDLLGWPELAVVYVDDDEATGKAFALADNRTGTLGGFDDADLAAMMAEVEAFDPELLIAASYSSADIAALLGQGGAVEPDDAPTPSLSDRFLIPPFTVFDGRSGWWRSRKRSWLSIGVSSGDGITSHDGRGERLAFHAVSADPNYYGQKRETERRLGRELTNPEFEADYYKPADRASAAAGTSVFDPVLCEIVYRWYAPDAGRVLDPWAGGSVRGIIAAMLGRQYVGVELRGEQVTANEEQASEVLDGVANPPEWITGDCLAVLPTLEREFADLVFGCPPYFDLEVYSDDPRDLSTMKPEAFLAAYTRMIAAAAGCLRPDRFAVLVVGSARSPRTGLLHDLRGPTVRAAEQAGLRLYNEAILVNPAGSLPVRAARQFMASRILGRTHQDVLVFVKGDRSRATKACGTVDAESLADALAAAVDEVGSEPEG